MNKKTKRILRAISAIVAALSIVCLAGSPVTALASSASTASASKPAYGILSADGAVYASPTPGGTALTTISSGKYIMIIGQYGDYYKVQYNTSGSTGYIAKSNVTFKSTSYYLKVNNISSTLNMRSSASTSGTIIASLNANTYLAYVSETTGWYRGVYGNINGYVSSSYVQRYDW